MYGLTQREIVGGAVLSGPPMLDKIARCSAEAFTLPADRPDLRDYITLAIRGGFPSAVLETPPDDVNTWVESYLENLLTRDVSPIVANRDHQKLEAYFRVVASMSAGLPEHKTLYDAAGINAKTATTYDKLLADLSVAEQVPAWTANHLQRLIRTPKRYVVDSSLMAASLEADIDTILGSSDLLGRTIDTFVMTQLRPEVAATTQRVRLYHARTRGGREEVDIVAELPGGKLIGIEMKASSSPSSSDAKHLRWFRAENPKRFAGGVVFHSGPDVVQLDDDIFAVPICAFWDEVCVVVDAANGRDAWYGSAFGVHVSWSRRGERAGMPQVAAGPLTTMQTRVHARRPRPRDVGRISGPDPRSSRRFGSRHGGVGRLGGRRALG